MNASRRTLLLALLAQAQNAIATSFTANTVAGSPILTSVNAFGPLAQGWPLFGPGIPANATVASMSPPAALTLSEPATATATGVTIKSGFRTVGRRLKHWSKVNEQPALFVRYVGDEYPKRPTGLLPKVELDYQLWLYARSGNVPDAEPTDALTPLIDAIEFSLAPSPAFGAQTLGGLVQHCWIEGRIEVYPGDQDDQAMALIPVRILAP